MGSVIMTTQNKPQNTPKNYDAGDMADVHLLAKQHLSWVSALVSTVIRNNKTDLCTRQISQNPYPIRILLS